MSLSLDGVDAVSLAARWGLPAVHLYDRVLSTMDLAHEAAAAGARAGTLVIANEQYAGRGRSGGQWHAAYGDAVLITLLERPAPGPALDVLSLRVGLALADALDPFARTDLRLKWPNDVYDAEGKVAGILIEVRWREQQPEWVAVGIGVNLAPPPLAGAARPSHIERGTTRLAVLDAIVPPLRAAVAANTVLTDHEVREWTRRDLLLARAITAPVEGVVAGIAPTGDLLVDTPTGRVACRAGSVHFKET